MEACNGRPLGIDCFRNVFGVGQLVQTKDKMPGKVVGKVIKLNSEENTYTIDTEKGLYSFDASELEIARLNLPGTEQCMEAFDRSR